MEGLGLRYGERWVLRRLSFALSPGDALVVTGPNGSGKSSLLRVLAGLVPQTEGALALPPRRGRGYSALDQRLYAGLSAEEHLGLFSRFHGVAARPAALEEAGLGGVAKLPAGRLSTGQQARLKLVLATLAGPSLLLLDEPSAALDLAGGEVLESALAAVKARGGSAVLATNDLGDLRHATHRLELAG